MRDRTFADFMAGAIACISVLGFYAVLRETELHQQQRGAERRRAEAERWALPRKRRRRHSPEDDCRHCTGSGTCDECAPSACRVCKGTGLQPHDAAIVSRLSTLWDGAA
jgi:DnaJ-class molecular chaperone